ncbi:Altered inheritance of mitochondria protein 6 [Rhizina undulata]
MLFGSHPRSNAATQNYAKVARVAGVLGFAVCVGLALNQVVTLLLSLARTVWADDIQTILQTWSVSPYSGRPIWYPNSFTRDITPKPIHSHNDYWRTVPLFTAISYGCISVEADVWEFSGDLFIGHDTASLTRNRTFRSMYVDPLVKILGMQNRKSEFEEDQEYIQGQEVQKRGVFDVNPAQTLHLFIDFKTPGLSTFPAVLKNLEPLRTPVNYLTTYNGTHLIPRQITVHLTGDAPFALIASYNITRDVFYDAPMGDLSSGKYNTTNSLIASTPFTRDVGRVMWGREVSMEQKRKVKGLIDGAHELGILTRFWDTPSWPISVRDRVWGALIREGADLLNVDDLKVSLLTVLDFHLRGAAKAWECGQKLTPLILLQGGIIQKLVINRDTNFWIDVFAMISFFMCSLNTRRMMALWNDKIIIPGIRIFIANVIKIAPV